MEFEKLSKQEKNQHWNDVSNDINRCLILCEEYVSPEIANAVKDYLSHNELGIALETLAETAIEYQWNISKKAKECILNTFRKMDYHKTDKEQFYAYENLLVSKSELGN